MYSPRQKILWFALSTRAVVIVLQAVSNLLVPDHNANVFLSPEDPGLRKSYADQLVNILLSGFKRWDAHYFLHIAQYGYTYENCLAFFPLYPLCVRYFAYALNPLFGSVLNMHSLLLISAVLINLFSFIKSADILHMLSVRVLRSESKAYKAAVLYCVNPASIFFSAPYSESMFAWMSFYTMFKCTELETLRFTNIDIMCSIPAGFSMVARSNGAVNLGFIFYTSFKNTIERTLPEIVYKYRTIKHYFLIPFLVLPLFASFMALLLSVAVTLMPFLLVQTYNYLKFCQLHDHILPPFLQMKDAVVPGRGDRPWCNDSLPLSYSYVQAHYWDVGFLKYYKLKQIPNFMLAAPLIFIVLCHCASYIRHNLKLCLRLGIKSNILSGGYTERMQFRPRVAHKGFGGNDPALFVYVIHATFLTLFCSLFVHVQVTTRLVASASPLLYWICASRMNVSPSPTADQNTINEHFRRIGVGKRIPSHHLSIANLEGVENMYSKWRTFIISRHMPDRHSRFLQYYFISYTLIGTVCFSNFYPWT